MTLRDLLKKKTEIEENASKTAAAKSGDQKLAAPYQTEFTFLRTTTSDQEVIQPPTFPGDREKLVDKIPPPQNTNTIEPSKRRRSLFGHKQPNEKDIRRHSSEQNHSNGTAPRLSTEEKTETATRPKNERKLSDRFSQLKLSRASSRDSVSSNLPPSLDPAPEPLPAPKTPDATSAKPASATSPDPAAPAREAAWEARATQLALANTVTSTARTPSPSPANATTSALSSVAAQAGSIAGSSSPGTASARRTPAEQAADEETLQEAIRLHEAGSLAQSTQLFGQLASPAGANSALAQVLYGLALRHGWGVPPDAGSAIHFLSLAASNSASIEREALKAGMAKGGAAKGELVLAIFELANCYRYGWGVGKDARAAREYYETAANLGDVDAMEEASWCYLEGFGGAKDKVKAAGYLRLAEKMGRKGVGNSWIWKEKYNPK